MATEGAGVEEGHIARLVASDVGFLIFEFRFLIEGQGARQCSGRGIVPWARCPGFGCIQIVFHNFWKKLNWAGRTKTVQPGSVLIRAFGMTKAEC